MAVRETSKKTHHSHEERVFDTSFYPSSQYSSEELYHQQVRLKNPFIITIIIHYYYYY